MLTNEVIEKLVEMGCNEWKKGDYHRIYVNPEMLGLTVDRYNSGKVSYAEFDEEKISNTEATKILAGKYYIDANNGTVSVTAGFAYGETKFRNTLKERIEEMLDKALA